MRIDTLHNDYRLSLWYTEKIENNDPAEILESLNLKRSEIYEPFFQFYPLPFDHETVDLTKDVFIIPKIALHQTDEYQNDYYEFDAYILVVDNKTTKILHKFHKQKAWISDALKIVDIGLMAFSYQLSENKQAFGIMVSYEGSSNVFPFRSNELSLFVEKDDELSEILRRFETYRFHGETDMNEGTYTDIETYLDISHKEATNGYFDIIAGSTIKSYSTSYANQELEQKSISLNANTQILKFDGKKYK